VAPQHCEEQPSSKQGQIVADKSPISPSIHSFHRTPCKASPPRRDAVTSATVPNSFFAASPTMHLLPNNSTPPLLLLTNMGKLGAKLHGVGLVIERGLSVRGEFANEAGEWWTMTRGKRWWGYRMGVRASRRQRGTADERMGECVLESGHQAPTVWSDVEEPPQSSSQRTLTAIMCASGILGRGLRAHCAQGAPPESLQLPIGLGRVRELGPREIRGR
jgi:hypothetical protein